LALGCLPAGATTFTVLNTNDSGADSLRAALTSAQNCTGAPHSIEFNVPEGSLTAGVAIITPTSGLPSITCAGTTVDGTTQTANVGNTNDVTLGTGGTVGTGADGRPGTGDEQALPQLNGPEVEIVGSSVGGNAILTVNADNVSIRGLSLHGGGNFGGVGTDSGSIRISGGSGIVIEQNVIGASATSYSLPVGSQTQDNLVLVSGGGGITIEENLMGFARWRDILLFNAGIGDVTIRDNEMKGSFTGVDLSSPGSGPNGTIIISRNYVHDLVDNGTGFTKYGLYFTQTGSTGSTIVINNTVRNVDLGAGVNTERPVLLQFNIVSGASNDAIVHFGGSEALTIDRNAVADSLVGIDLGNEGVTANEGLKPPAAPNDGMDYPVITSASLSAGMLTVEGYVGSNPGGSATFTNAIVQLFKADNAPANQRGEIVAGDGKNASHGEGAIYLATVTANASGLFDTTFAVPMGVTLLAGDSITATATDQPDVGNTSEFGPNAQVPIVLDIDANGSTDALTDGLLVLRFLFGFTGSTLVNGAVGAGCMRCTADAITSHLTELDFVLDIDDNNALEPLTDGLLVLRYLFGFSGATLTNGAVGGSCERCDATMIGSYLTSLDN
jgi:hypothetical protein